MRSQSPWHHVDFLAPALERSGRRTDDISLPKKDWVFLACPGEMAFPAVMRVRHKRELNHPFRHVRPSDCAA
jgi:hypothetical protein